MRPQDAPATLRRLRAEEGSHGAEKQVSERCVVYVTDEGYLFPTLVSAMQARALTGKDVADVLIVTINVGSKHREAFSQVCELENIKTISAPESVTEWLDAQQREHLQFQGRVSASALGRLLLADILPKQYSEFLYIDGDTQIVDRLDPLMLASVPEGRFMAARDYGTIMAPFNLAFQGAVSEHHDRLGLSALQRRNYLNSGVIRSNRNSWATLSDAAIRFFMRNPNACEPFHDQGALNGACIEALVPISIRWNYPRQFMHLRLENVVKPAIYHFMAHPKPWHGPFLPWGRHHSRPYRTVVMKYPHIGNLHHKLGRVRSVAYALKTTKQFWHEVLTGPSSEAVGREIRNGTYAI